MMWFSLKCCRLIISLVCVNIPCDPYQGRVLIRIDISVGQWLGLTPAQIVMDTLNLTNSTVSQFKKEKQYIVPGAVVS